MSTMGIWQNDPAIEYLREAAHYMNQIVEIDYGNRIDRMITEAVSGKAVDPVIQSAQKNNAQNAAKSTNALKKACGAVMNMINNIITSIQDFINKLFMSSEERASFEEMKKAIESNPELKGKKLKVKDYRQINQQYDALIKKTEAKIREVEANENADTSAIFKEIESFLVSVPAAAASTVTAEVAVRMAASDIGTARMLSKALSNEKSQVSKTLKKFLGDKQFNTIKKDINACGKTISLRRKVVQLMHGQYKTKEEAINSIMNDLNDITPKGLLRTSGIVKNAYTNPTGLGKTLRGATKTAVKAAAAEAVDAGKKKVKSKIPGRFKDKDKYDVTQDTENFWGINKATGKAKKAVDAAVGKVIS